MAKYRIGLALSGGSVKGFAHVGVLKYLDEVGIRPDIIAGTSAGSLAGAFYADGCKPDEIMELFRKLRLNKVTTLRPIGTSGLLDTSLFRTFIAEHFISKRIEDLGIPLRIVATDLDKGEQHIFTEGDLALTVMASCSIPVLFHPIEIDGTTYVDGGLFRNFPASVIRDECDVLIGMNLELWDNESYKKSITAVAERSWRFVFRQNTLPDKECCDVLLESKDVLGYGLFEIEAAEELMKVGYQTAKEHLTDTRLKELNL